MAAQYVIERGDALQWRRQPHDGLDALRVIVGRLLLRQVAAVPIISHRRSSSALLLTESRQSLGSAIAVIGSPVLDQPLGVLLVEPDAIGLIVGTIVAADLRPFVPKKAQPAQSVEEIGQRIGGIAPAVRILNAQDKLAPMVARE